MTKRSLANVLLRVLPLPILAIATCGAEGGGCGSIVIGEGTGGGTGTFTTTTTGAGASTISGTTGAGAAAGAGGGSCEGTWSHDFAGARGVANLKFAGDPAGHLVLAGTSETAVDFGGGPLPPLGNEDIVVAKLDCQGNVEWSRRFGPVGSQTLTALTVDIFGRTLLAGQYLGTIGFGEHFLPAAAESTAFLAMLSEQGEFMWGISMGHVQATSVAFDNAGNAWITGQTFGTSIDFGNGPVDFANPGAFIAKYGPQGDNLVGVVASHVRFNALAFGGDNEIFIAGDFDGSLHFGSSPTITAVGGRDMFVEKLDPIGNTLWVKSHGSPLDDRADRVVVDGDGGLLVAGYSDGTLDLGGGPLPNGGMYVLKLDPQGQFVWNAGKTGQGDSVVLGLTRGSDSNVYVSSAFGPQQGLAGCVQTSLGVAGYLIGLDAQTGALASCHRYGGAYYGETSYVDGIASLGLGRIAVGGTFAGKMDLGNGTMTSQAVPLQNDSDAFAGVVQP